DIVHGVEGADLSGFSSVYRGITRPNERTITGVHNWLMRLFQLDTDQHGLNLMGMVSRAREGFYWELVPLNATSTWRKYVDKAVERPSYSGWRPTGDVAGSSSQVPRMAPGSEMDDYDYDDEEVSGHSERYGRRSPTPFDLDAYMAEGQHDTLRPSQLSGAPPMTQPSQQYDDTPAPAGGRPTRQVVPPSPLTYSAGHVRAGRKAPKPGTVRGVPPKRGRH
ncbi:hypothetical protein EJB05_20437, partial [Eragrostis curvula]